MPFAALDLRFHSNPKILKAGNAAVGLFAKALSYCADHLTDGLVPKAWAQMNGTAAERKALTEVGLWIEQEDYYVIPDYLEYNWSRQRVEEHRAQKSQAGRKGAEARWGPRNGDDPDHPEAVTVADGDHSSETSAAVNALMAAVGDSNQMTGRILRKHARKLPPAAFYTALETLQERRSDTSRAPLESEARYVSTLLKDYEQQGYYGNGAAA